MQTMQNLFKSNHQMRKNNMTSIKKQEQFVRKHLSVALHHEEVAKKITKVVNNWSKYPSLNNEPYILYEKMRDENNGKYMTLLTSLYGIIKEDIELCDKLNKVDYNE